MDGSFYGGRCNRVPETTMFLVIARHIYQVVMCICLLWCVQGDITTDLNSPMNEISSEHYREGPFFSTESSIYIPSSLDIKDVQKTILPSHILSELQATATPLLNFLPVSSETILSSHAEILSSYGNILSPTVPETHTVLHTSSKETFLGSLDFNNNNHENSVLRSHENEVSHFSPESSFSMKVSSSEFVSETISKNSIDGYVSDAYTIMPFSESSFYPNFHTPLMSLLAASSSISFSPESSYIQTSVNPSRFSPHTLTPTDNESALVELSTVPADYEHKKLLMLVLRAEDCTRLSKADFEKMLGKLMAKFGFGDVVPEVSNAKCYSHLNINLTIGNSSPTLRFLPNVDGKNITVDVLNRTFRIVKLEKVDLRFEKSKSSNSSSHIITKVAKHESVAYIAVGVSFGLVLIICVTVCCIKCCCLRRSQKRFNAGAKCSHVRLRPEDYTLTPIPRPTSLYVDYYRGSVTADIYSTTSAGSIASTTPTVEQGVIQPFDTSIVPLEDSATLPLDSSRDPSVESVPVQSDMKTFNIHSFGGKGLRIAATDSKEQLNPKQNTRRIECKPSGVANPTFQRY